MFGKIIQVLLTILSWFWSNRDDIFSFISKIKFYDYIKDDMTKIKLRDKQLRFLKGETVEWDRQDGQTFVKLLKMLYDVSTKSDTTYFYKHNTIETGELFMKMLGDIIKHDNNKQFDLDEWVVTKSKITNKKTNSTIVVSSIKTIVNRIKGSKTDKYEIIDDTSKIK